MRPTDLDALDDLTLVDLVRGGDTEAFGELWRRHAASVTAAARRFTGYDPDDVTSEAFARVLRQLRAGGGPESEPRAYLVRAARNVAAEWARRDGGATDDVLDEEDLVEHATPDHAERVVQREAARAAYERLPERWRHALWMREVEDLPVGECARLLGASPNSTTVLLKRAREGFAQEWIRENIARAGGGECGWVISRLPRYTRGKSTQADAQRITRHLAHCRECAMNGAEARHLQERLVLVLLPALFIAPGVHRLAASTTAPDAVVASVASGAGRLPGGLRSPRVLVAAGAVVAIATAGGVTAAALNGVGAAPDGRPGAAAPAEPGRDDTGTSPTAPRPAVDASAEPADATVDPIAPTTRPRAPTTSASPSPDRPAAQPSASPTAPAEPDFVERAITVNPIATAPGLYPTISGTATSGASITVNVTGGGRTAVHTFTATAAGTWSFTARTVAGLSTAVFSQTYTTPAGQTVSEAGPTVTFTVDPLVDGGVVTASATSSSLMLLGPAGASVEVDSAVPGVSGTYALDGTGSATVAIPIPRGDVTSIRWRLVSGELAGPWTSWP
ncbi:sigma-70 family RNA polymerase sigma factor [Salinibacterium sp. ZJ77]|uniref:sigma-70 family RNA polymerase sigma factor n=1 Tax=Salinibacterium sp. ZJ77 TaxID=2708337 RepID=UPI00141ED8FD|nr:sigma-70 family RNA polymerase sigma factor [Salinibacterium sp. ZJ77]